MLLRIIFAGFFLLLLGCNGGKKDEQTDSTNQFPRSNAKEVSQVWEVPKEKARAAQTGLHAKQEEERRQAESLEE